MNITTPAVLGLILAGGLARRMGGGDKCLLTLGDKTLLQHAIDRVKPQVTTLVINANGDPSRFANTELPVVADQFANNLGPLAGIHAGLTWMQNHSTHTWLASVASDTPFFPTNLIEILLQKTRDLAIDLVVACTADETQAVFALWHISLLEKIAAQLNSGVIPRTQDWIKQQNTAYVEFNAGTYNPFFNINTHQDLNAAEAMLLLNT